MRFASSLLTAHIQNKKWILIGVILYLLPVFYRFLTQNSIVPFLDNTLFFYYSNSQVIPVNLETLGSMFVIPAALGAIIFTKFLENISNRKFSGYEKYLTRLTGSLIVAVFWIALETLGYNFFNTVAPWGNSFWEGPDAYPRSLFIAITVAPLLPYLIEYLNRTVKRK